MKKQFLLTLLFLATFIVCQNPGASASKRAVVPGTATLASFKFTFHAPPPKPFLQFVGGVFDPLDSTTIYDMYGSSGSLVSVIVFKSGVQQSSAGISISGTYHSGGGTWFIVTGTLTRADSTTFSVNGTYDIS